LIAAIKLAYYPFSVARSFRLGVRDRAGIGDLQGRDGHALRERTDLDSGAPDLGSDDLICERDAHRVEIMMHGNSRAAVYGFQTLPAHCARRPVAPLCARRTAVVEI
jgi:hypothetical protein